MYNRYIWLYLIETTVYAGKLLNLTLSNHMKDLLLLFGQMFLIAYEKDIKGFKETIHRKIKDKEFTWEDYVLFSLALIVFSLAYILVKFS